MPRKEIHEPWLVINDTTRDNKNTQRENTRTVLSFSFFFFVSVLKTRGKIHWKVSTNMYIHIIKKIYTCGDEVREKHEKKNQWKFISWPDERIFIHETFSDLRVRRTKGTDSKQHYNNRLTMKKIGSDTLYACYDTFFREWDLFWCKLLLRCSIVFGKGSFGLRIGIFVLFWLKFFVNSFTKSVHYFVKLFKMVQKQNCLAAIKLRS